MTHSDKYIRPDRSNYYMTIAMAVRRRANCMGNRVGALIVKDDRIISTGYNGTPQNMTNCEDGGCERCNNTDKFRSGEGYDLCVCVHAEQNAILSAARFGTSLFQSELYTTMRPCFGCTKELLQAGIIAVYYLHEWIYPDLERHRAYLALQKEIPLLKKITLVDPDESWAISTKRNK